MSWTNAQHDAIKKRKEVLVSASAGSGKTAVLIENVFERIRDPKGDIARLVVITFTKASAAEMKERLAKRLQEEIVKPALREDPARRAHLAEQMQKLSLAYIGTIDGFCSEVYRRYFEDLGGEPAFSVTEPAEAAGMFRLALQEETEARLAAGDEEFDALLAHFTKNRKTEHFEKAVRALQDFLTVQVDPDAYLEQAAETATLSLEKQPATAYLLEDLSKNGTYFASYWEEKVLAAASFLAAPGAPRVSENARDAFAAYADAAPVYFRALQNIKTLEDAVHFAVAIRPPILNAKLQKPEAEVLRAKNRVYAFRDALQKFHADEVCKTFNPRGETDEQAALAHLVETAASAGAHTRILLDIIKKTRARYAEMKRAEGKLDFADMEHFALEILQNETRAAEFRAGLDAVYVDEYQDTNRLQDAIIGRISKENVFMVGDVKQSIYGFRHAEPALFLEKKARYNGDERFVALNHNFRSAAGVLRFVNGVFSHVMTTDFGGVAYAAEAVLTQAEAYDIKIDPSYPAASVRFYCDDDESVKKRQEEQTKNAVPLPPVYRVKGGESAARPLSQEALYIAKEINKLYGKLKVYGKDGAGRETERLLTYGDIAILVRTRKNANDMMRALKKSRIPFRAPGFGEDGEDYYDIDALVNFLSVVDNYRNDIPLFAVMRSHFGGFSETEVQAIRAKGKEGFFWENARDYQGEPALQEKLAAFFAKLRRYARFAAAEPVGALMHRILTETEFDGYLLAGGDPARIERVNAFIFSLRGKEFAASLGSFLPAYEAMEKNGLPVPGGGEDSVQICTVHASKGLEYPVVFLAAANFDPERGKALRDTGLRLDQTLGVFAKWRDEDAREEAYSLTGKAIEKKKERAEAEEFTRLLYVALTRARAHLIVTGTLAKRKEEGLFRPEKEKGFANWIQGAGYLSDEVKRAGVFETPPYMGDIAATPDPAIINKAGNPLVLSPPYRHAAGTETHAKYTVSALNAKDYTEETPHTAILDTHTTETGNVYHAFLEHADFSACSVAAVSAQIAAMKEAGLLPAEAVLSPETLSRMMQKPLFDPLRAGGGLREQPFLLYVPAKEVRDTDCADKVLVQGVIDLVLPEEGILIDYKVSGKPPEWVKETYKKQMLLYKKAAESLFGIHIKKTVIYIINQNLAVYL